jgi:bacterioferritin-associated ferredoxin
MQPDDELCLCFHITRRKVTNYIRIEKPRRPTQLSECYGAGTGCGWCRPFLKKLWEELSAGERSTGGLPSAAEYACDRSKYVRAGHGTPPAGATPIDEDA